MGSDLNGALRLVNEARQRDYRNDREDAARNLLAHMRDDAAYVFSEERGRWVLRWEPGTFVSKLIELLLVSDQSNRALLSIGFPAYVWAVATYKDEEDGLAILADVAGWEPRDA